MENHNNLQCSLLATMISRNTVMSLQITYKQAKQK